jgi:ferredoxin-like protein FixX
MKNSTAPSESLLTESQTKETMREHLLKINHFLTQERQVHSKVLQKHKEQMETLQLSETCSSRAFEEALEHTPMRRVYR